MLAVPQDQQSKLTALTNVLEKLQQQGMMSRVSSIDLTHVSCMVLRLDREHRRQTASHGGYRVLSPGT